MGPVQSVWVRMGRARRWAPSALGQGGTLGPAVGTRLAGSSGNLELGIFLSVSGLYVWTEAGLWELPARDQAVRGITHESWLW